jgi:hypothetical protein
MFKYLSGLFKKKGISSPSKRNQIASTMGGNSGITAKFNYQDAFHRLAPKFFCDTENFFRHDVMRPNLAGKWNRRDISLGISVFIFEYFPVTVKDSSGIALMSAAVYDKNNKKPHSFYVLIERNNRNVIRQVDESGNSWALDVESQKPDIDSFAATLQEQCEPSDAASPEGLADLIAESLRAEEEEKAKLRQDAASQLLSAVGNLLEQANKTKKH